MAAAFAAASRIRSSRPSSQDTVPLSGGEIAFDNEKGEGVKVEFKNVSFKYPTRNVAVLDQLNISVSLSPY